MHNFYSFFIVIKDFKHGVKPRRKNTLKHDMVKVN